MKYFFDTEFIEDGKTIDLLSIGIVSEDGREFYAQNGDADLDKASDWVCHNVFPELLKAPDSQIFHKYEIAPAIEKFVTAYESRFSFDHKVVEVSKIRPQFWAYYADYDWVVLCQLFGTMMQLPQHWPKFCMDVKQYAMSLDDPELPPQLTIEHNALNDAHWTKQAFDFLDDIAFWRELQRNECQ